jgi:uncharacterized membrane protein YfhO
LENPSPGTGFPLTVNGYETTRKANNSIYRTYIDDLTIRIPASESIQIRMPKGDYELTGIQVFQEPYDILKEQAQENSGLRSWKLDGSHAELDYENAGADPFLALAIPYERGWTATVNGESVSLQKANYAFIGVPIQKGGNHIELSYRPPFFTVSFIASLLSLLLSAVYLARNKKKSKTE